MAKVVVVHGIGKQYLGRRTADAPALAPDDVEVAFCLQFPPA
ncbi:hypothetical protein [Streptomyces viridochromogenes]|uniref:Uncharacterized protein n=1 Tax=Streptomyces viridochromogenes Tue57 TaxID=1160705 RepID=L8PAT3_STRVR|nr:hypothetical protein [Streptomyces viridochromogenes]ELS52442.1 hypothetical protein STVIR_6589 [Streptomyces viridochromogenes Tue57]